MGKILIEHVDVEVGMGLILSDDGKPRETDVVYRIELPTPLFQRLIALDQLKSMSRENRSTWARLVGHELPAGAR